MSGLYYELSRKLLKSRYNNYGIENYDSNRFKEQQNERVEALSTINLIKNLVKRFISYNRNNFITYYQKTIDNYVIESEFLYKNLNKEGRKLLVELLSYRILGCKKVKLSINNRKYRESLTKVESLKICNPNKMVCASNVLQKFDLNSIGYPIQLFFTSEGVLSDFLLQQYLYKTSNRFKVGVEEGDIVLDVGGCWADTALYFAFKAGQKGRVYSFEFNSTNLEIFELNINLNSNLKQIISLIKNPVSDISGENVFYTEEGPGSKVIRDSTKNTLPFATTISIDDFVIENSIEKVDFIKMDIEGSELRALKGATATIRKFKPTLAIAIYHDISDLNHIPRWIIDLNLGYKLYISHYTIHLEETILFAKIHD